MPQPAISHGVHGPWPNHRLETAAASAPTANPGAAPTAKPVMRTTSVVATTFGIGVRTRRPATASAASAATSATSRAGGRERSYQANPPRSAMASRAYAYASQLIACP